jgi:hypothetical protein
MDVVMKSMAVLCAFFEVVWCHGLSMPLFIFTCGLSYSSLSLPTHLLTRYLSSFHPLTDWHVAAHPSNPRRSRVYFSTAISLLPWIPKFVGAIINKSAMNDNVSTNDSLAPFN